MDVLPKIAPLNWVADEARRETGLNATDSKKPLSYA